MTLTRLPDPVPERWEPDYTVLMTSEDWYGARYGMGKCYGNFWARRPCRIFPHRWLILAHRLDGPRSVYRCQRCGSQVHCGVEPPRKGTW